MSLVGKDRQQRFLDSFENDDNNYNHLLFALTVREGVFEEQVFMRLNDPVAFADFSERQLLCGGREPVENLLHP